MTAFTVKSWNNTAPEDFGDFNAAVAQALARAAAEGALVKLRDNTTGEVRNYSSEHGWSKWQNDHPFSIKEDLREAADEIDDPA